MELEVFAGQEKSELSMIEVARAILELRGRDHEMYFSDLVNEIQNYLEKSNSEIREALPLFYTELNVDGSFIPLGDNKWGLRSWYAIDEVDEEIIALEETDEDETPKKRKKKRVNAFMDGDEDAIDYNDDDPEDEEVYELKYTILTRKSQDGLTTPSEIPCNETVQEKYKDKLQFIYSIAKNMFVPALVELLLDKTIVLAGEKEVPDTFHGVATKTKIKKFALIME